MVNEFKLHTNSMNLKWFVMYATASIEETATIPFKPIQLIKCGFRMCSKKISNQTWYTRLDRISNETITVHANDTNLNNNKIKAF